jgi:hypothetical protein
MREVRKEEQISKGMKTFIMVCMEFNLNPPPVLEGQKKGSIP